MWRRRARDARRRAQGCDRWRCAMMPRGGWPYSAPGAGSRAPVCRETLLWNSHWVSHISSKTMQGAADKSRPDINDCIQHSGLSTYSSCMPTALQQRHTVYGLPLTISKLHSHGHLPWTSAKALAPSGPMLLERRSMAVSDSLTLRAFDAMAQRLRR